MSESPRHTSPVGSSPARGSYSTQSTVEVSVGTLGGRFQAGIMVALLGVLVVVPLYMWRRPPAARVDFAHALASPRASASPPDAVEVAPAARVVVTLEAESCSGRQGRRLVAARCESLEPLAASLSAAAERAEPCRALVESGAPTAALSVVVEFSSRTLAVQAPRGASTGSSGACAAALTTALASGGWGDLPHAHTHYVLRARVGRAGSTDTRPAKSGHRPRSGAPR